MKNTFKRVLSFILALTMVLGLGVNAFAVDFATGRIMFHIAINGELISPETTGDALMPKVLAGKKVLRAIDEDPEFHGDNLIDTLVSRVDDKYEVLYDYQWDGKYYTDKNLNTEYGATAKVSANKDSHVYLNYVDYCDVLFYMVGSKNDILIGEEILEELDENGENFVINEFPDVPATPASEGYEYKWVDANGKVYEVGSTIPAEKVSFKLWYKEVSKTTYTVTFDPDGGNFVDEEETGLREVYAGTAIGVLPEVEREGYRFLGWNAEGETGYWDAKVVVGKDYDLKANWEAINYYDITFDANGGKIGDKSAVTVKVVQGEKIGDQLPTATKDGYALDGWKLGTENITEETVPEREFIAVAQWKAAPYKAIFHYENLEGEDLADSAAKDIVNGEAKGTNLFNDYYLDPTGYKFVGIYDADGNKVKDPTADEKWNISANVEYTYRYQPKTYTVVVKTQVGNTPTSDIGVIEATYDKEFVVPTFNEYLNDYPLSGLILRVVESSTPKEIPVNIGDKFVWNYDCADAYIVGKYSATKMFNVAFVDPEGNMIGNLVQYTNGQAIGNFPEVEPKVGHTVKWYNKAFADMEVNESTAITGHATFVAKYVANTYTAAFKDPMNTGWYVGIPFQYGDTIGSLIAKVAPNTYTGYKFAGWKFDGNTYDGTSVYKLEVEGGIMLLAEYEPLDIPVTLDANGGVFENGEDTMAITIPFGANVLEALKAYTPVRAGYVLDGWYYIAGTRHDVDPSTPKNEIERTYNANWTDAGYQVTFSFHNVTGAQVYVLKFDYHDTVTGILDTLAGTEEGKKFAGWFYYPEVEEGEEVEPIRICNGMRVDFEPGSTIEVYPEFSGKPYKISFNTDGGNELDSVYATYGEEIGWLPTPVKTGYDFIKWTYGIDITKDTKYTWTNDVTFTAVWAKKVVKVYFLDEEGNELYASQEYKYAGALSIKFLKPVKTGYDFKGWYSQSGKLYENGSKVDVEEDLDLTAKFEPRVYNIWFIADTYKPKYGNNAKIYGEASYKTTATYDAPIVFPEDVDVVNPGYDLVGWTDKNGAPILKGSNYTIAEEANIYAKWEPHTYTVTFNVGEGGYVNPATIEMDYLEVFGTLPVAYKEGYTATQWKFKDITIVPGNHKYGETEDITLDPVWVANSWLYWGDNLKAILDLDGGAITTTGTTYTIKYDMALSLPVPTKTGYTFAGWEFVGEEKEIPEMPVMFLLGAEPEVKLYNNGDIWDVDAEELKLKAVWTPNEYTLTFKTNGGEFDDKGLETKTVTFGEEVGELPTGEQVKKTGYSFANWKDGDGKVWTKKQVWTYASDGWVEAQWTPETYTITFNPMGGVITGHYSFGPKTMTVTYDKPIGGELPVATKTGYTFGGWLFDGANDRLNCTLATTDIYTAPYYPGDDLEVRAKWTPISSRIYFDGNKGTVAGTGYLPVQYGETYTLPDGKQICTRTGYTFSHWTTDKAGNNVATGGVYNRVDPITLYAQWDINTYKVILKTNNAAAADAFDGVKEFEYGQTITAADLPTIDTKFGGYQATGRWYYNAADGKVFVTNVPYAIKGDVTLYAEWEPATFTVSYSNSLTDCEPYTTPDDIKVKYGEKIKANEIPVLSKVGYTWLGWSYAGDNAIVVANDSNTWGIKENTVLHANWEPKTYTLTINRNNGDEIISRSMTYGKIIEFPADPAKTGYTFAGWYIGESKFTSKVNVPYNYDNNVTIEAKYTANKYTVTFDAQDGTLVPATPTEMTATYGSTLGTLPTAKKTGYTFVGWNFDAGKDTANVTSATTWDKAENTTVYAVYTHDVYVATFDYQGGKDSNGFDGKAIGYFYGAVLADAEGYPTGMTKTGYEFAGWKIGTTDVTASTTYDFEKNIDVVANWTAHNWKITFKSDNGTGEVQTLDVTFGQKPDATKLEAIVEPEYAGHTFQYWMYEADSKQFVANNEYLIDNNSDVKAVWNVNTYHVTIDTANGVASTTKEVKFGAELSVADPTRTGYTFAGWKVTLPAEHEGETFTSNAPWNYAADGTITAQWTAKDCTIRLQLADGESLAPSEKTVFTVKYDSKVGVLPDAIKTGYTFKGWIEKNTKAPVTAETVWKTVEETTLVPTWEAKATEVTFNANGGEYGDGDTTKALWQTYDKDIKLPAKPTKVGYTFKGWYTDSAEEVKAYTASTKWDNEATTATLWAHWTAIEYSLTFNYNDDTAYTESWPYTYGEQIGFPTSAGTKIGYTFKGWAMKDTTTLLDVNNSWYNFTGDVTIEALWEAIDYKVNYYKENALYEVKTEHYGKLITLPAQPTKVGYDFVGWFFKDVAEDEDWVQFKADTLYAYAADVNVYAEWTPKTFTVTLDSNAPQNEVFFANTEFQKKVITVTYDATSEATGDNSVPNNLYRKGYHFTGWYLTKDGTGEMLKAQEPWKITQDTTYYAGWEKETYKVEFVLNFDDLDEESPYDYLYLNRTYQNGEVETALGAEKFIGKTVTYGKVASQIPSFNDMALKGYTLRAWVAVWNENETQMTRTLPNDQNAKVWDIDVGEPNDVVTMYAIWEANKYTVKYDVVGNLPSKYTKLDVTPDGFTDYEYVYFDTINAALNNPEPTKVGYIFDGWYVGETKIEDNTRWTWVADDFTEYNKVPTLKAHWTPEVYTITFKEDGTGYNVTFNDGHAATNTVFNHNLSTLDITYDTEVTLPTVTAEGYDFDGWFNTANPAVQYPDGPETWQIDLTPDAETNGTETFYAHWTAHTNIAITFNTSYVEGNGLLKESRATEITPAPNADFMSTYDVLIDDSDLPVLTLKGYEFLGWFTEDGDQVGPDAAETALKYWRFDEATTLYAQWEAETYEDGIDGFDVCGNLDADELFHKEETINPAKATYDALEAITVTYDTLVANNDLPADPTIEGYTFLGWDVVDSEGTVLGNVGTKAAPVALEVALDEVTNTPVKLAAKWQADNYGAVECDPSVDPYTFNVTYGMDVPTNIPTPTKPGYAFAGWYYYTEDESGCDEHVNTTAACTCIKAIPGEPWSEPTNDLHAHWTAKGFTVYFNPGTYGSVSPKSKAVVYDQPYGWLPTPSYGSYTFLGWVNQNNVLVDSTTIYKIDGDSTLYASFRGSSRIILDYRNMAGLELSMDDVEEVFLGEVPETVETLVPEVVEEAKEEAAEEAVEEVAEEVTEEAAEEVVEEAAEEVVEETTEVVLENRNSANAVVIDGGDEVAVKEALEEALETEEVVVIKDGEDTKAVRVIGYNAEKDNFEIEEVTEINPDTGASVPANIAPAMFALLAAAAFAFGKRK